MTTLKFFSVSFSLSVMGFSKDLPLLASTWLVGNSTSDIIGILFSSPQGQIRILSLEQEGVLSPRYLHLDHCSLVPQWWPPHGWFSYLHPANQRSSPLGCPGLQICPGQASTTGRHLLGLRGHTGRGSGHFCPPSQPR